MSSYRKSDPGTRQNGMKSAIYRKLSVMSLENTRSFMIGSKTSRISLSTGYETMINGGRLKGFLKMKNLNTNSSWKKLWIVLEDSQLLVYFTKGDLSPSLMVDLVDAKVMPADWLTKQKFPFRVVGLGFDLLFGCESKLEQVKWMNAAGLIAIGYSKQTGFGGSGIRKTRYKNCSMRIYRKVFRKDSKKDIVEGEENADVKDTIDVDTKNIEPVRTSPIRTRMMKPIEPKTDELIYLIDDIDIGSGLTRRQTMKRRIEQLAIDPAHNELLHQKLKYERQLKAMFQDLSKINDLLGQNEIRDCDIDRFQIENSEVVPGLRELFSSEIDSINSSVLTSASSEISTLSN